MAANEPITLHEGNDETVAVTVTAADAGDDLDAVTALEWVLKDDPCADDADALVLTTADPTEITITAQDSTTITAEVYVPASALTEPYPRHYRLDTISTGDVRRTALYGVVTVVDL